MKKITLKPVSVPLPRDMSSEVRMSVAKAEEAMRENNRLIEEAINNIMDSDGGSAELVNGILHIS